MKVLVTGGAGYIGGVVVDKLLKSGYKVVIVDNLSSGRRENVEMNIPFFVHNCGDKVKIQQVFKEHNIELVMHFAASALIAESVKDPSLYFHNNVVETLNLLNVMREYNCNRFILSSSGATFGEPEYTPIDEEHPQHPINPYGLTKLINEQTLKYFHDAYGLKYNVFRYFNAAGATETHGEIREVETHIIPLLIKAAEDQSEFILNGNDFPTEDGTCIRDYIHVSDLAEAHIKGIENVERHPNHCYNLGNGKGFSNLQVLNAVKKITGTSINFSYGPRRPGDPAILVASSEKAWQHFKWQTVYTDLQEIVSTAYRFKKNPKINNQQLK
jgi:UDP-glucose 4-epimerase